VHCGQDKTCKLFLSLSVITQVINVLNGIWRHHLLYTKVRQNNCPLILDNNKVFRHLCKIYVHVLFSLFFKSDPVSLYSRPLLLLNISQRILQIAHDLNLICLCINIHKHGHVTSIASNRITFIRQLGESFCIICLPKKCSLYRGGNSALIQTKLFIKIFKHCMTISYSIFLCSSDWCCILLIEHTVYCVFSCTLFRHGSLQLYSVHLV